MIAGVAKCGTTTLFHGLATHPDIRAARVKELNWHLRRRSGAPLHTWFDGGSGLLLEASPQYWVQSEKAIASLSKSDIRKVFVILRDPSERFWSAFRYLQSRGRVPEGWTGQDLLDACLRQDPKHDVTRGPVTPLTVGEYAQRLRLWLDAFPSQLRIIFFEQLRAPEALLSDLWSDLGLVAFGNAVDIELRNPTRQARSARAARLVWSLRPLLVRLLRKHPGLRRSMRSIYEALNTTRNEERIAPELRARLDRYYAPSCSETAELLHGSGVTNLPNWLETSS